MEAELRAAKQSSQHQPVSTTGLMMCDSGTESDDDELEMLDSRKHFSHFADLEFVQIGSGFGP